MSTRSQNGNNNCYCQDNELTWCDWSLDAPRKRLLDYTVRLIQMRREHPNLHRRRFFQDRQIRGSVVRDIVWFSTDGNEISDQAWEEQWNKSLAVLLNGKTLGVMDEEGQPVEDDTFLILVNASDQGVEYVIPESPNKLPWRQVINTEDLDAPFAPADVGSKMILGGRCIRVLCDGSVETDKPSIRKRLARTL
jgi:isoamylase